MTRTIILFDMDGVLLESRGYHQALQTSLMRIGSALGVPDLELTTNQIARFETLSVTNEWDTLAICTAWTLLAVWHSDGDVRLKSLKPQPSNKIIKPPDFNHFLEIFDDIGRLPGHSAYELICVNNPWLNEAQREYLSEILHYCRDIYRSPTLPGHQETVIGSSVFERIYGLKPQLNSESFLLKYDRPILTSEQYKNLQKWLSSPEHNAAFITNRPCNAPDGYLSAPEAEMGAKLIGLDQLPLLGSGLLSWYASTRCSCDSHELLKPNPVHTLAAMKMCSGLTPETSIEMAVALIHGDGSIQDWSDLMETRVIIFEDSTKGLKSGIRAMEYLSELGIKIDLSLIGVSVNNVKRQALKSLAHRILSNINEVHWDSL